MQRDRCTKCGRPRIVHKTDHPDDYLHAYYTCTATVSQTRWGDWWRKVSGHLPAAARQQAAADKRSRENGVDPDLAREWMTYTRTEGPPT